MTDTPKNLEPLASELQELIELAHFEDGPDEQTQNRLYHRLAGTLGLPLLPTTAAGSGALAGKTALSLVSVKSISLITAISAGIGIMGVSGWLIYRDSSPSEEPDAAASISIQTPPLSNADNNETVGEKDSDTMEAVPEKLTDADRIDAGGGSGDIAAHKVAKRLSENESMAAERLLIESAREALRKGFARDSLVILKQHKKRFFRGRFAEEHDALQIMALAKIGNEKEAQRLTERFLTRYPKSMFKDAVHAALKNGM